MKRVKTIDIENLQSTKEMRFSELTIKSFLEELTAEEMQAVSGGASRAGAELNLFGDTYTVVADDGSSVVIESPGLSPTRLTNKELKRLRNLSGV
ncbi:bacteriocin [Nostoc sp. NMS4]|uniref:bacteriocin n=1 Tax=Nostoc sp. NMS4 TaxID=2815390 RepID=UPI00260046D9|nr:bacteriocin [Nostoc sp. NMS4]MBN3923537.1 bacteriocin [Nostoc sp. NMS4]